MDHFKKLLAALQLRLQGATTTEDLEDVQSSALWQRDQIGRALWQPWARAEASELAGKFSDLALLAAERAWGTTNLVGIGGA